MTNKIQSIIEADRLKVRELIMGTFDSQATQEEDIDDILETHDARLLAGIREMIEEMGTIKGGEFGEGFHLAKIDMLIRLSSLPETSDKEK
jgi:hypothetical protein